MSLTTGPVIVTNPLDAPPLIIILGLMVRLDRVVGNSVNDTATWDVPKVAVIVGLTAAATGAVVIVKLAELWPARTVTVGGTDAATLLDDRLTTVPPAGAEPGKNTVPVSDVPPSTFDVLTVKRDNAPGVTVTVADWDELLQEAVIPPVVVEVTAEVEMANDVVAEP